MTKIVLASKSPRRKELMSKAFGDIKIVSRDVNESCDLVRPSSIVKYLAQLKMADIDQDFPQDIVLSADTIVYMSGKIYGKPHTKEVARKYLRELSGKTHCVYTGVCISYKGNRQTFYDKSYVKFYDMTDEMIDRYIDANNPLDKAGAYGIQDKQVVKSYKGSYTNIVGLPMEKVEQAIRSIKK